MHACCTAVEWHALTPSRCGEGGRERERERERERDLGEAHSRVGCVLAAPTQPLRRHLPAGTTTAAAASVTGQGPWGHKQEE